MPKTITVKNHFDPDKKLSVRCADIEQQAQQYDYIAKLAEKAGLIAMASGGIMLIIHPHTQLDDESYHKIQFMTGNKERCQSIPQTG